MDTCLSDGITEILDQRNDKDILDKYIMDILGEIFKGMRKIFWINMLK